MKAYQIISLMIFGLLAACATVSPDVELPTVDERAITAVIQGIVSAYNARDLEAQLAAYAVDAKIESLLARGAMLSRDRYAALRRGWTTRGQVFLRSVAVRVLSDDTALATALFRLIDGSENILGRRSYRFTRRDGQWLVVEARFVGPIPWEPK